MKPYEISRNTKLSVYFAQADHFWIGFFSQQGIIHKTFILHDKKFKVRIRETLNSDFFNDCSPPIGIPGVELVWYEPMSVMSVCETIPTHCKERM